MPDYVRAVYTSVKNTWQDAENLDATHGYITYIWIPEETFKVDIMKLHVYSEKFRAFSKSALGGGAAVKTSSGGGVHSHTVTGATSSAVTPSHQHNITIGVKTSVGGGGVHHHKMFDHVGGAVGYTDRWYYTSDVVGGVVNVDIKTDSAVDLYTWTYNIDHTHDVDIGTPTSQSGGGNHSHTISGQTTNEFANHTHTVTLTNHTHDIEYGIYEEAITARTLSAILYDPDGNELKDFGVVLTGEDSDILDLTDYFETLKYGMYKIVLSASGRLRARLVFYELCKMFAQF